jgi:hypothetical protein
MMVRMLASVLLFFAVTGIDGPIGADCSACHAAIVARYRTSAMANAMGAVDARELAGLARVRAGDTGFEYRFEAAATAPGANAPPVVVESWRDVHGKADAVDIATAPLVFAIGAGRRDRSFAARRGDLLWFAPLEAMRGSPNATVHARLAPGHEMQPGLRFELPVGPECLACHTDAPPPDPYPGNVAPRAEYVARGIGCETCHAHASEHATWQSGAAAGETRAGTDPLSPADPADPIAGVSTCARCHLQGDAHLALDDPWKGVPAPAQDLCATRAVFVAATPTDEIGFVSQAQRMVMSRCFTASLARFDARASAAPPSRAMTCTTCHDPHASALDDEGARHARKGCTLCHPTGSTHVEGRTSPCSRPDPAADPAAADCVTCHLRATGTFDVAEVVIHDHRIVRVPPPPSAPAALRAKETQHGDLAPFTWPGRAKPAWVDDPGLFAMAYAVLGDSERALEYALREPGKTASRMPTYFHTRGSLLERAGKTQAAVAAYERALALDPSAGETSVNLGALLTQAGDTQRALEVLNAEIARHPQAEGALRNRAVARLPTDPEGSAADLEAAFRIRPQASVARVLAQLWKNRRPASVAKEWSDRAHALDPRIPR